LTPIDIPVRSDVHQPNGVAEFQIYGQPAVAADRNVNGFEAKWSTGFRNQHGLEIPPSLRPRPEEKSLNYFGSRRGDFLKISLSVLVNMPP
jgi:hypothetical protein